MDEMPPQDSSSNPPSQPASPVTPPLPPPPFIPPPPVIAPPRPKGRGCGVWVVVVLAIVLVLGMSLFFMMFFVKSSMSVSRDSRRSAFLNRERNLQEFYIEYKSGVNKIAVIDVQGIIMDGNADRSSSVGMVEFIRLQLKAAARDKDVKAVVLRVNSPGGEVLAADEINRAITKFQKDTKRPVIVSMGSLAASGGYYVSAPCRWIVANELTITGSIGVIMHGYNFRGLMDKVGVRPETFKSGKFKDMLSGDREPDLDKLSPEEKETRLAERKMVQDLIDETYGKFKEVVQAGRNSTDRLNETGSHALVSNWQDYADGRVFSGKEALKLGFVDELGNFDVAVSRAKKLADIQQASLIQYRQPFNLGSFFNLFDKTETPAIKVDLGINEPKLEAGHLYLITPIVLF